MSEWATTSVQIFSLSCTEVARPCHSEWIEWAVTRTAGRRGDGFIDPFPVASPTDYAVNVNVNVGSMLWPIAGFVSDKAAGLEPVTPV